jgi:hypothetical protein
MSAIAFIPRNKSIGPALGRGLTTQRAKSLADTRIDYQLRAEKQFKKAALATEGAKAMSEYKAEAEAERTKTVRLRAQRLAKEAAGKKK